MLSKKLNINGKKPDNAGSSRAPKKASKTPSQRFCPSKLSAGPSNPNHKTYLYNEALIREELNKTIAKRSISVRVSQICKNTKLSAPTFYLHHRNADDALTDYEDNIYSEFLELVIANINHSVHNLARGKAFELLLIFIRKNREYFQASLTSNNLHLLYKVLQKFSACIITNVSDRSRLFYITNLLTVIMWWGNVENFAEATLQTRAQEMASTRIWARV